MKTDSRFLAEDAAQIVRGQADHARGILQCEPFLISGSDVLNAAVNDVGVPRVRIGGEAVQHILHNGEQPGGNRLEGGQRGQGFLPLPMQKENLLLIHSVSRGRAGQKDQKL